MTELTAAPHSIRRVRHETRRRSLTVTAVGAITPRMKRITLAGDLEGFASLSADDHIKLFFADDAGGSAMRDFTPRAFDVTGGTITIDFALHEAGPATSWAAAAVVGDGLEIGGPRGSAVVPDDFDWYWLIGDETALPAIGRWVEGLRPGVAVMTAVAIADRGERQAFATRSRLDGALGRAPPRRQRRHCRAAGADRCEAAAGRRRLRLHRRGKRRRPRAARAPHRARPAQGLHQGRRLLEARRG